MGPAQFWNASAIRAGVPVACQALVQMDGTQRVLLAVPASRACSRAMLGKCVQCTGGDYAALLTLALVVLLGTAILHIWLALLDRTTGAYHGALLSAALCVNQLITCAQLFRCV